MGISFGSVGTGLPKDIVQQLIKAEEIPITRMEARKEKIDNKKKLVSDLIKTIEGMKGELDKNRGLRSFRELTVEADSDAVKVAVDKNLANPGSWQLEVVQLAQKSSIFSNGIADKDKTNMGVGYIAYNLPNGESREIYVDAAHASLTGIAKLINADSNSGMHANVMNDGKDSKKPWRLAITLDKTGDNNKADWPYFYLVDAETDLYIQEKRDGHDAKVKLDGFEIEVPENKLKDLINGAVIDLKKAKPGEEFTLQIKEDTQKITEKMTTIIDKINDVLKFIKEQNTLSEKTDTTKTLGGDITLQQIESRIRNMIFTPVETSKGSRRIGDLGINFNKSGLLEFDAKKFEKQISEDYKSAADIVVGMFKPNGQKTNGFLDNLNMMAESTLQKPYGTLSNRKQGLQSNIDQIDRQIETRKRMIEQKERTLKDKFARLEETMSKIKGQGAGLSGLGETAAPQQLG